MRALLPPTTASSSPALSFPPTLTPPSHSDPQHPHHPSNNPVRNLPLGRVSTQLQSQAAIDHRQRDEGAAPPDVSQGPDGAALVLFVEVVVEESEGGLQEEEPDYDDAYYWMAVERWDLESGFLREESVWVG